jgi:hypothetical protein
MIIHIDSVQLKKIVAEYIAFRTGTEASAVVVKFEIKENTINTKISIPEKQR